MTAKTIHFRVDNGDMTLIELESGAYVLVDINIRADADDESKDMPDVAAQLRKRLEDRGRDSKGRLYVDAFLLTHPDKDHISGLKKHFHLGDPSNWSKTKDKIFIREMWSSPVIFRRASKKHTLCDDACDWSAEARRRVQKFRNGDIIDDGNRILILGEDVDGKTDDITDILVKAGETFTKVNGKEDTSFQGRLFAPMLADDDEEDDVLSKNNSSVVVRIDIKIDRKVKARYLLGGDAEVAIWEKIWDKVKDTPQDLEYDVLLAPHHCSWHSLSYDSWSDCGEDAKVSPDARKALGQALSGALIVSSSKPIEDDEDDPPCIRAKREYESILEDVNGDFRCVSDGSGDMPLIIEIGTSGAIVKRAVVAASIITGSTGLGSQPFAHGEADD